MRKITLILYVSVFFISTFLFSAFAKGEYRNLFNSKFSSYAPELSSLSYFSTDHENYLWVNSLLAEIEAPVVSNQEFCGNATIANLVIEGEIGATFNWFSSATSTTILPSTTVLTSTTYYVSQTVGADTSERVSVLVTIKAIPDAPVSEAQLICGAGVISDLEATGIIGGTIVWYATATSTTALSPTTVLAIGTYFVSQTVNGCESSRTSVAVTVNTIPEAPIVPTELAVCAGSSYEDVFFQLNLGDGDFMYSGSNDAPPGTFFIKRQENGCNSETVPIVVTELTVPVPTVLSQVFCEESTVADLVAEGAEGAVFNWYDSENSVTPLGATTVLASGVYYVSQVINGCESERVAFYVKVLTENTVGTGTAVERFPLGNYYGFERSIALYTNVEVAVSGVLNSVAWQANVAGQGSRPIKIYLKETPLTDLTAGATWANFTTGATLVYDGTVTPLLGWNMFLLTTPFTYSGANNLLVLVEANGGGSGTTGSAGNEIRYSTMPNKHRTWQQDSTPPTTSTGSLSNNRPNINFNRGTTMQPITCLPPTNLISTTVTSDAINVSWTASTNVTDDVNFGVYFSTSSNPIGFCTLPMEYTEDTAFSFSMLESNTDYYIWVRGDCQEDGGLTNWLGPIKVRTLCTALVDFPFIETFSTTSTTKDCWSVNDVNGDGDMWDMNYSSNPFVGDRVAMLYTDGNAGNNNDWLISPKLDLSSTPMAKRLKFHYRVQSTNEPNDFRVMASTTGTNPEDFTIELMPLTVVSNTNYLEKVINLVDANGVPLTGNIHIAFHVPQGGLDGWRLYIDNVIVDEYSTTCPNPTNLQISEIGSDSLKLSWTAGGGESAWEVLVLPVGSVAPNFTTIGYLNATTNPYVIQNLTPSTAYDIYVRAKCSATDKSAWAGIYNIFTSQIPATLPYNEGFEGEIKWDFFSNTENKWVVGTAVSNTGDKSLYVSNDNGVTHAYTSNSTVAHAYRDIAVPGDVNEMYVGFDWMCFGEGFTGYPYDYFRVWAVPVSFQPTPGVQINAESGGIQLGTQYYNNSTIFLSENIVFDATAYAGQTMRLIFEWRNDGGAYQPPAAIDNLKVAMVTCSAPSNVVTTGVTENSVSISWTAPGIGGGNYDLYLSTAATPPTDATLPTATTTNTNYTFENLTASTQYYIWVRTNCGAVKGKSFWKSVNVRTNQIPATLPYSEGFEGANNWGFSEGPMVNKWVVGTAVNNGGIRSLYISKDNGVTHTYETSGSTVVHAYRDFFVEEVSGELELSFDRLCNGEGFSSTKYDYLNVWVVPSSYSPVGGVLIENMVNNGGFKLLDKYNGNAEAFLTERFDIGLNDLPSFFSSGHFRIVFEWRQDSGTGYQPPAAIDNLEIKKVTCPAVINLQSEILERGASTLLTWTPTGNELLWEVFIIPLEDNTVPDGNTVGIIVDEPQYEFNSPVGEETDGVFFKFYVRPICSEDDKGNWSKTGIISFIPPPGCANVEADIEFSDVEGLVPDENGNYIICQDEPVNLTLGSSYFDILKTDVYRIEEIEYRPPFPFVGGGVIEIEEDDFFSEVIDLGFDFCFFGNKYDKVSVNTNGAITFSIAGVVEGGRYIANNYSSWSFNTPIPVDRGGASAPFVNSVFGVLQDSDPTDSPDDYSINYQVIGKAPCRTLVFNMYHLGMFSCGYDPNNIEGTTQTSQIVLYEGTNIIEVYVKNRIGGCGWNSGSGLIGIQNANGTIAYTPPGRNTGTWSAAEEAWRFVPDGESTAVFEWQKDGEFYSSEPEIEVSFNESVKYTARASYEICGEVISLKKEFNFLKENFNINGVNDLVDCSRKPGELNVFELRKNDSLVLGDLDPEKYTIEYFIDESDANNGENALPDIYETLQSGAAYVKLTNLNTGCYKLRAFRLTIDKPIDVTIEKDGWACISYEFPNLKPGEAYFTRPFGEGDRYEAGDVFDKMGIHTFYIYRVSDLGCFGQSSFKLEIVEGPKADIIDDQLLECETFFLPKLSEHNRYFTQSGGQGVELSVNSEIRQPMTIYVYAEIIGSKGLSCVDESSFTVDYKDCPLPKGISPNGDGLNDTFDLSGYGILDIKIYNRYGIEVFSYGDTYTNQWFGQDKAGQALPDGTYYYVAIANGKVRTGWVQINR